jgi:predicted MFS family arabinose efflux permease
MNLSELRAMFALGSIFALRMLGLFMIVPIFAIYGQDYTDATPALIGLAIGIYGLTQAVLQIPLSLLADRTARKPLIVVGLLLFALGGAISAISTSIWGVILGRAIAGSGAISAIAMALLADVTREEHRNKAMAAMGMTIGLSFILAFSFGPVLTEKYGLSGLFWLTSIAGILAIGLLALVPSPLRLLNQNPLGFASQLKSVLALPDLNRLHVSIFALHLLLTAAFVMLPQQLVDYADISVAHQGWYYLPLLLLGALMTIPAIILAEVKRRMRRIFIAAVGLIVVSLFVLMFDQNRLGMLVGIGLLFISFNIIEAMVPSWLAKRAPVAARATAMGINASSQFLGAFAGGVLGGQLLTYASASVSWGILAGVSLIWFWVIIRLGSPPYLSSLSIKLPSHMPVGISADISADINDWASSLLNIEGVEDIVVLPDEHVAYLKVDKRKLTEYTRRQLCDLTQQELVF